MTAPSSYSVQIAGSQALVVIGTGTNSVFGPQTKSSS